MTVVQQSIIHAYTELTSHSAWETQWRQHALNQIQSQGLPQRSLEAWKYTHLTKLHSHTFSLAHHPAASPELLQRLSLPQTATLVFVDGRFQPHLSTVSEESFTIHSLGKLLQEDPEQLRPYLNQAISHNDISFAATNTALFQDGLFIQVPKQCTATPLVLLFLTTEQPTSSMHHVRNIIVVQEQAQANFFEYHLSLSSQPSFNTYVNEIFLQPHSHCDWLRLQALNAKQFHISETAVKQLHTSQFHHINIDYGSELSRHDIKIDLEQSGASCKLHGLYDAHDTQQLDNHTLINHLASHTTSYQYYKGVINDHARAVFNGRIIVHPHVQGASTEQRNPNLLLSANAEINTKPQLEIYNDQIKASHSATIGQLDENAIFYLQSRGMERHLAIQAIVQGFCKEIIQQIPHAEWQAYINTWLEARQYDNPH